VFFQMRLRLPPVILTTRFFQTVNVKMLSGKNSVKGWFEQVAKREPTGWATIRVQEEFMYKPADRSEILCTLVLPGEDASWRVKRSQRLSSPTFGSWTASKFRTRAIFGGNSFSQQRFLNLTQVGF